MRGLWEDSISRPYSQKESDARTMLQGGGRVRRADGEYSRWRPPAAPADPGNRQWADRASKVHLPVHERAAAKRENRPVQAEQIPDVQRPHGRAERPSRFRSMPGG